MSRILLLALLFAPVVCLADSIYRTTDEQGNVVFTDAPPANSTGTTEQVDMRQTNTIAPPDPAVVPEEKPDEPEATPLNVQITSPANETSFPMGPGNFSVSAIVKPDMPGNASLQLFLDGNPWGEPQQSTTWELTNVFRGAHDLTVGLVDGSGETAVMSDPVRVFVHRPSINFRNRAN